MSTEQDQVRALAERIAARLAQDGPGRTADAEATPDVNRELDALRTRLGEMQQRLAQIEAHVTHTDERAHDKGVAAATAAGPRAPVPPHWTSSTYIPVVQHPSQERFGVDEAVSELVDYFERETVCNVEPGGKPCDHCAMCNSRGF